MTVTWTTLGFALFVLAVGLAVAGVVTGIASLSGFAPIAFTLAVWFLCCKLFALDRAPWEQTRVAIVLLIACFSYTILGASLDRHGAALAVVSLYLGYIAWRETRKYADPAYNANNDEDKDEKSHQGDGNDDLRWEGLHSANPLGMFAALLLAIFLMIIVVSPLMGHFFPRYWDSVTTQLRRSWAQSS